MFLKPLSEGWCSLIIVSHETEPVAHSNRTAPEKETGRVLLSVVMSQKYLKMPDKVKSSS